MCARQRLSTYPPEILSSILTKPLLYLDKQLLHCNLASTMTSQKHKDGTMMAAVVYEAGGPEVIKVEKRRIPKLVSD